MILKQGRDMEDWWKDLKDVMYSCGHRCVNGFWTTVWPTKFVFWNTVWPDLYFWMWPDLYFGCSDGFIFYLLWCVDALPALMHWYYICCWMITLFGDEHDKKPNLRRQNPWRWIRGNIKPTNQWQQKTRGEQWRQRYALYKPLPTCTYNYQPQTPTVQSRTIKLRQWMSERMIERMPVLSDWRHVWNGAWIVIGHHCKEPINHDWIVTYSCRLSISRCLFSSVNHMSFSHPLYINTAANLLLIRIIISLVEFSVPCYFN